MPHKRGDYYAPVGQSRKRERTEVNDISQLRDYSNSYRPKYEDDQRPSDRNNREAKRQKRDFDQTRPVPESNIQQSQQPPLESAKSRSTQTSTKSKHDRKSNPSSRIHSLRNLLARDSDNLPRTVRQEKERELTALLLDQEKARLRIAKRQNLKRYHMVRFFERRKAERNLKRLLKQRDELLGQSQPPSSNADSKLDSDNSKLLKSLIRAIHECETDIAYTIYSPLGSKYISLFVEEPQHSKRPENRVQGKKQIYNMFTDDEKRELRDVLDETTGVMRNAAGVKPPMWYEVERCQREGGTEMLEKLRDGKVDVSTGEHLLEKQRKPLVAVGGKAEAKKRKIGAINGGGDGLRTGGKRKASFLEESGHLDPADLDSENDDMSDGDGGFFEK